MISHGEVPICIKCGDFIHIDYSTKESYCPNCDDSPIEKIRKLGVKV